MILNGVCHMRQCMTSFAAQMSADLYVCTSNRPNDVQVYHIHSLAEQQTELGLASSSMCYRRLSNRCRQSCYVLAPQ